MARNKETPNHGAETRRAFYIHGSSWQWSHSCNDSGRDTTTTANSSATYCYGWSWAFLSLARRWDSRWASRTNDLWTKRTNLAIPNSNPTPAFVAICSYEKNVKPSNGHLTNEDATKATVTTKKSDWSKVRTYRLSTHTPPRFKLRI
jgi:hypothetical protein